LQVTASRAFHTTSHYVSSFVARLCPPQEF
jgi:hypothetical protein